MIVDIFHIVGLVCVFCELYFGVYFDLLGCRIVERADVARSSLVNPDMMGARGVRAQGDYRLIVFSIFIPLAWLKYCRNLRIVVLVMMRKRFIKILAIVVVK
jgi:hypothetical protein